MIGWELRLFAPDGHHDLGDQISCIGADSPLKVSQQLRPDFAGD
ncbi:hypothetical protein [Cryobacterium algoricola]|nr:hypothetical protein [Cryobacterium algoricola]